MNLILRNEKFKVIPEVIQEDFIKEFLDEYEKAASYNLVYSGRPIPGEQQLLDLLSPFLLETGSYYLYEDPFMYRNIMADEGMEIFYKEVTENYYKDFLMDVYQFISFKHLSVYNEITGKYTNLPIKEVW